MTADIYLDHNATTPIHPDAAAAMVEALRDLGNPSSVHRHGRRARAAVERARAAVAALVGAPPAAVVFTSGGTEANALAIRGAGRPRVLVSAVEHPCVLDAVDDAAIIPVDGDGRVDVDRLDAMLAGDPRPALVAVMLANNETGVLQPIDAVVAVARRHGARIHCDAVQAAGRLPLALDDLGVDSLALSAHKLGGPMGMGAVILGDGAALDPLLRGGGQERRRRAGTENVAGIVGFGVAAERAAAALPGAACLADLRGRLEAGIRARAADTVVFAERAPRLPNTSCFATPGLGSDSQVIALDLAGVAVSAGAACSSGSVATSHVLRAMGVAAPLAACAIRVSLGRTSMAADVDAFLAAWGELCERVRGREDHAA
jgi:cysteine desulfurase